MAFFRKSKSAAPRQSTRAFWRAAGRALADQLNYWFGPKPAAATQRAGRHAAAAFDYPVGYNINIQPRNLEASPFEQLRSLAMAGTSCALH